MVIWVIKIFFCRVLLCILAMFLISSASVKSIPFLSFIVPIFAWNVPLVSLVFLEISSLSHSVVFLYFFALITEEGFLISPYYSLELCLQLGISFLFSFAFSLCINVQINSKLWSMPFTLASYLTWLWIYNSSKQAAHSISPTLTYPIRAEQRKCLNWQ